MGIDCSLRSKLEYGNHLFWAKIGYRLQGFGMHIPNKNFGECSPPPRALSTVRDLPVEFLEIILHAYLAFTHKYKGE